MIWSLFCIGVFVALLLSNPDTAQGFSILSRSAYHNALQLYSTVRVALTREREENAKLADALRDIPDCDLLHLPCLTFQERDDVSKLKEAIVKASTEEGFVLTSPQASKVFLRLWRESGRPAVRVATVGEGTSTALRAEGLSPYFEPSEALGEALAAELPTDFAARVFFACSALAADAVPDGLRRRGFQCERIDAYSTVPATWQADDDATARAAHVVTIGSPSAAAVWTARVAADSRSRQVAVAIGPTSQQAAKKLGGFAAVHMPREGSRGLRAWAETVREVVATVHGSGRSRFGVD
eukprot:gene10884-7741_t